MDKFDEVQDYVFLGREFLTWLLWRADRGDNSFNCYDRVFTVTFNGRICLGSIDGDVVRGQLDGQSAAYSIEARAAIGAGRTINAATIRFVSGEREWSCVLTQTLDLRGVKIPALLVEETDDRFGERMSLLLELHQMVQAMYADFLKVRTTETWRAETVPAIGVWVTTALEA